MEPGTRFSAMGLLSEALSATRTIPAIDEEAMAAVRFNSFPTCQYRDGRRREAGADVK